MRPPAGAGIVNGSGAGAPAIATASRATRTPLLTAALACAGAFILAALLRWATVSPAEIGRSDFLPFRDAAVIVQQHGEGEVYDLAAQVAAHRAAGGDRQGNLPFANPPLVLPLLAPLASLSVAAGYRLWTLLQLACLVAACAVAARTATASLRTTAPAALLALASAGMSQTFVEGQWDGLIALLAALGIRAAVRRQGFAAGWWLALAGCAIKPQLGIGVVALLLGWACLRALAGAALAGAVWLALCLAAAGPSGLGAWLGILRESSSARSSADYLSLTGLVHSVIGRGTVADVAAVVLGAAGAAVAAWAGVLLRRGRLRPGHAIGVALCATLLVAPHLWVHDVAVLCPLVALLLAETLPAASRAVRERWRPRVAVWLVLSACALVDVSGSVIAAHLKLTPFALAALAWLLLRSRAGVRARASV